MKCSSKNFVISNHYVNLQTVKHSLNIFRVTFSFHEIWIYINYILDNSSTSSTIAHPIIKRINKTYCKLLHQFLHLQLLQLNLKFYKRVYTLRIFCCIIDKVKQKYSSGRISNCWHQIWHCFIQWAILTEEKSLSSTKFFTDMVN